MGKKQKQLVGYQYFLGMHMIVCHTPDAVTGIEVGEKPIWYGYADTNQFLGIYWPELFGGVLKEGGIAGKVDIDLGGATQPRNEYLMKAIGPVIPAFRGVLSIVLNQCYVCAMSPYPKPWRFRVRHIHGRAWYPSKAEVGVGDNNPAHMIYACYTNTDWGMGYDESVIDLASFVKAADTLHEEGLGLSMMLSSVDSVENFIRQIAKHANGVVFTDPVTQKFVFKLLRDDYEVDDLQLFDETNIISLESYETPAPAEIINEIVCRFRPQGTTEDDSVTVQELASIQSQQGIVSQEVNYPGISNAQNASRVAMRELRTKSTPLRRLRFKANRTGSFVTIGSVIKFAWAAHRVSGLIIRVTNVNFGNLEASEIIIDGVEDVFGLPFATYLSPQPSEWVDPIGDPSPLEKRTVDEATYWEIQRNLGSAEAQALPSEAAFMTASAGIPDQATPAYELWTMPTGGTYGFRDTASYCPTAKNEVSVDRLETVFVLVDIVGNLADVSPGSFAKWGTELIRFDSYDEETGEVTVGRGVIDTVPVNHEANEEIFFNEDFQAVDSTQYAEGETAYAKLLMRTSSALLALDDAPEDSITFQGRYTKPYVPGLFKINGEDYPGITGEIVTVSWAHRDRKQQLGTLLDQTAGNVGPETGVEYVLRVYNDTTGALLASEATDETEFTPFLPAGSYAIRIELESKRDDIVSWQKHSHVMLYSRSVAYRITEDDFDRITEDGDLRILEDLRAYAPTGISTYGGVIPHIHLVGDEIVMIAANGGSGGSSVLRFYKDVPGVSLESFGGVGSAGSDPVTACSVGNVSYGMFNTGGATKIIRVDRAANPNLATHQTEPRMHYPAFDMCAAAGYLWEVSPYESMIIKRDLNTLSIAGYLFIDGTAIATDNEYLYICDMSQVTVYKISDGTTRTFPTLGDLEPTGALFDAGRLFIQNRDMYVYNVATGELITTFDSGVSGIGSGHMSLKGEELAVGTKIYNRVSLVMTSEFLDERQLTNVTPLGEGRYLVEINSRIAMSEIPMLEIWE